MRMIAVVAALALSIGCNKKKADPPATPPPPPPAPADAAPVVPATDAALPAGIDAAQAATAPPPTPTAAAKAVCCESTGDATHDSLELSEAVCTGPGLEGDVVKLEDCGVKGEVPIIAKGQTITIAAPGQYVGWPGGEDDQLAACEIRLDAKTATVKCMGGGDKWKKTGKATLDGTSPLTFTPGDGGAAVLANGATSWKLTAEYREVDITWAAAAK